MVLMERWSYSFLEIDPLEYVFKRLGQTYNVEFILKDAELGKIFL